MAKKNAAAEAAKTSGLFNKSNIAGAKDKALNFVNEVKSFITTLNFWDWVLLIAAVAFGIAAFTDLFGDAGKKFAEKGQNLWARFKRLGFWKTVGLIVLIVFAIDRAVKVVARYQAKNPAVAEETETETNE